MENNGIDLAVVVAVLEGIERRAVAIDEVFKAIGGVVEAEIGELSDVKGVEALWQGDGGCCGPTVAEA